MNSILSIMEKPLFSLFYLNTIWRLCYVNALAPSVKEKEKKKKLVVTH